MPHEVLAVLFDPSGLGILSSGVVVIGPSGEEPEAAQLAAIFM